MAGARLSDDQCLDRLRAYKKFGSIKAASEATGMGRQAIRHGVEEAQRRKLEKDEARATAPFILITHDTVESAMRAALERIEKDGHVAGHPRMIRIERL